MLRGFSAGLAAVLLCSTAQAQTDAGAARDAAARILTAPWKGPYGGVPPLDRVQVQGFKPALTAAMAGQLAAIDKIAANPQTPTFANTLESLERSYREPSQVAAVYYLWQGNYSSPEFQKVESEMEPLLAAHQDKITQNARLYARIKAVYEGREKAGLTPEQQRLAWLYWNNFRRAGAELSEADKAKVAAINQELAGLFTRFSQNLLADEERYTLLTSETELAGLPDGLKAAAAAAAKENGQEGKWAILNTRSAMEPFLTYSTDRALREKVWRNYVNRGDNGDAHDNNAIGSEILKLRAERAKLLGYPTHAHWRLENAMAKTPENAMALMMRVWPAAVSRAHEEVADMQALADKEGANLKIEPWDYRFYAEKVRKARYDFDEDQLRPYLQLEKLTQGLFWAAEQLYGLKFTQVHDVPLPHPDVTTWRVTDRSGKVVGLYYQDPYARPGKRGGAWNTSYRDQETMDGPVLPLIANNSNFVKPAPGQPLLISWTDAVTLFHEFGHALHGLNSHVVYNSLSGTNTPRDHVEFPSQLNEYWLSTPEVLTRFALHYQTGAPLPHDLIEKLEKADTFNQGFETVEYLADAILDMELHLAGSTPIDLDRFERDELARIGMPHEIVLRHRLPQFFHIFDGDGYSAGYYSYLWSETLAADAAEAFREKGSFYDPATAKRLHDDVMAVGNSIDPADGYRAFRGRDPDPQALMRHRGFAPAVGAAAK